MSQSRGRPPATHQPRGALVATRSEAPAAATAARHEDSLFGMRRPRIEDDRLLAGRGAYLADIRRPNMLEVAFVRSQLAHGRVVSVDTSEAEAAPGVVRVVVSEDLDGLNPIPDFAEWARPVRLAGLAGERVRYVGAPVTAVVATSRYAAEDAAELVFPDIEPLEPITTIDDALAPGAPRLFEGWDDNCQIRVAAENFESEAAFSRLQTVAGTYTVARQAAMPIETRGVLAEFRDGRLTVWSSTQLPHMLRTMLGYTLELPEGSIRVVAPDVGGAFGAKAQLYPEELLIPWLAMQMDRPVRWVEDRYEHLVASVHGRDMRVELEAAIHPNGAIEALRGRILQDLGAGEALPGSYGPAFVTFGQLTGPYRVPIQDVEILGVVTNKTPAGAFRGYGFPEATFAIERLVDKIAGVVGRSGVELRRTMLLDEQDLPYSTPSGVRIDSGSHRQAFERCITLAEEARQEVNGDPPQGADLRIGVGVATFVEGTAGTYFGATGHWTAQDACDVRFEPDGGVTVAVGVSTTGQGVVTMVATVVAELLAVPIDRVRVVIGDTDATPYGLGGWGSRSTVVVVGAVERAAAELRRKGRLIASALLEADVADTQLVSDQFRAGDRSVSWRDVAQVAMIRTLDLPEGVAPGLEARASYEPPHLDHVPDAAGRANAFSTYSNSTHAAVVAVDTGTGLVEVLKYIEVHDSGKVLNPVVVEGQIHGGIVQGIGGALLEELPYSPDGQPLATSFLKYTPPSVAESPPIVSDAFESRAPEIPFGVKGVGETGIIGPGAVIAAAIEDALHEYRIAEITRIPVTPIDIAELLHAAGNRVGS